MLMDKCFIYFLNTYIIQFPDFTDPIWSVPAASEAQVRNI